MSGRCGFAAQDNRVTAFLTIGIDSDAGFVFTSRRFLRKLRLNLLATVTSFFRLIHFWLMAKDLKLSNGY
jgi:hypothetical protein